MTSNYRFHGQLFNLLPALVASDHLGVGLSLLRYLLKNGREWTLMSLIIWAWILFKIICFFINRIVCQMHIQIAQITANRWYVLWCRESGETFVIYENSKWINARDENINSQVKFKSIDQVRLMQITLGDIVFSWDTPVVISSEENAFSLTAILWLNNEGFRFSLVKLLLEVFHITWEHPCIWKELEVIRKVLLHR